MSRDMVLVARALVREGPYDAVERILLEAANVRGLDKSTMRMFEDAFAKGCVHALARHGGWRMIARRAASGVKPARVWQVCTPSLSFSRFTYELCRWLVEEPLGGSAKPERFDPKPRTIGDELVAYLACSLIENTPIEPAVGSQPGLRASALAWLGFPRMLLGSGEPPVAFEALVADPVVLEGLAVDLARRAARFERELSLISAPARLRALGEARGRTLDALVTSCIAKDRVELTTFIVDSADAAAQPKKSVLDKLAPMRERLEARRASGAHLRVLARLAREHEKARTVSYIDEGYATAQLLLTRWEHVGNVGFARASNALAEIEAWNGG